MSRRSLIPTGQPECQEYLIVARDGIFSIFAEKTCGFGGALLVAEGIGVAGWDGAMEIAAGGDALVDAPPQAESARPAAVMTAARGTQCITEGLHGTAVLRPKPVAN